MIIIGLGSGRSGTLSLTELLNVQPDTICFHELNASCVRFSGTPRPILNTINEFGGIVDGGDPSMLTVDFTLSDLTVRTYDSLRSMSPVRRIGDVSFYYLSYVEEIAEQREDVRFICLKRDRSATIKSWSRKSAIRRWKSKYIADRLHSIITRDKFYHSRNFWVNHDGTVWKKDPVWDKCFPKFQAEHKEDAIASYWDYYYEEADRLKNILGDRFFIVETEKLSEMGTQQQILNLCQIPVHEQVHIEAHTHRS